LEHCGDWVVDPGELCDDGNLEGFDSCHADCGQSLKGCGNGVVDPGEECDDGNADNWDGCTLACQQAEQQVPEDGCSATESNDWPDVAVAPDGRFMVVWRHHDGLQHGVRRRLYDAEGLPTSSSFEVSEQICPPGQNCGSFVGFPRVILGEEGGFTVFWQVNGGQAPVAVGTYRRRFNADGGALGPAELLRADTSWYRVSGVRDGSHLVATSGQISAVQRYAPNGTLDGSEISMMALSFQHCPVATNAAGKFAVVCPSRYSYGSYSIMVSFYDRAGESLAGPIALDHQEDPALYFTSAVLGAALSDDDQLLATWWLGHLPQDPYECYFAAVDASGASVIPRQECNPFEGQVLEAPAIYGGAIPNALAARPDGSFVLAFQLIDTLIDPDNVVYRPGSYIRRFDATGSSVGTLEKISLYYNSLATDTPVGVADHGHVVAVFTGEYSYHPVPYPPDAECNREVYMRVFDRWW
jgi:cysteine-rich repeat protein